MNQENGGQESYANDDLVTKDWFLQMFVSFANQGKIEIGVTLNIGNCLVSGTIVSGKTYFEHFAEEFKNSPTFVESQENMGEPFLLLAEKVYGANNPLPLEDPDFIHIKNAVFLGSNGPIISAHNVWWRGRISEVQGFTFSTITLNP